MVIKIARSVVLQIKISRAVTWQPSLGCCHSKVIWWRSPLPLSLDPRADKIFWAHAGPKIRIAPQCLQGRRGQVWAWLHPGTDTEGTAGFTPFWLITLSIGTHPLFRTFCHCCPAPHLFACGIYAETNETNSGTKERTWTCSLGPHFLSSSYTPHFLI